MQTPKLRTEKEAVSVQALERTSPGRKMNAHCPTNSQCNASMHRFEERLRKVESTSEVITSWMDQDKGYKAGQQEATKSQHRRQSWILATVSLCFVGISTAVGLLIFLGFHR